MGYEPQKFFIGVIDLFSVLLPGAVLTYFLKSPLWKVLVCKDSLWQILSGHGCVQPYPTGSESVAIFLITSYLLGHFIFLLGSALLDDPIYDPVKDASFTAQIARLAKGDALSPAWARLLAKIFIKDSVQPVRQVIKIKEYYLGPLNASFAINAFQWAKAQLALAHPEAIASVQRFEADSKFFRSLFVVLCVILPWGLATHRYALAGACLPLLALAFWRYIDQRLKATNQAYWYIITLESQRKDGYRRGPAIQPDGFTHAGGVVYRREEDKLEYLLVQATDNEKQWVLPKGHINPGERMQETAVREVREESGVWAAVRSRLSESAFTRDGEFIKVQFYLMEALEEEEPKEQGRRHLWLALDEALKRNDLLENHQELLKLAGGKLMAADQVGKATGKAG